MNAKRLQSKNRARRLVKRRKQATTKPKLLNDDAPEGAYLIDEVTNDILLSGAVAGETDRIEILKLIRSKITFAAQFALMSAKNQYVREPKRRWQTKRFFEDLQVIRSRIERNKDLGRTDLVLSISPRLLRPPLKQKGGGNEIDRLLAALQNASKLIGDYLERYKPAARGGHHDYRTRTFIGEVFELWCDYLWVEVFSDESQLFIRLIAAAWRDVGFPTGEEDGRCLEEWLADRVRKQFPEGVPRARVDRQASECWTACLES